MVLTIAAIVLFQVYWLRKSYAEESKVFTLRTHLLFRETLFKLQATKLHMDTSFNFRAPDPSGVLNMVNVVREKVTMDSMGRKHRAVIVSMGGSAGADPPDSGMHKVFFRTAGNRVADFLSGVDSLQD